MTAESERGAAMRAATRLRGRVLLLARAAWVAVALLIVAFFVAGEFLYVAELRTTVCEEGAEVCAREALLTPGNVREPGLGNGEVRPDVRDKWKADGQ